jgi:hypothetical protein
MINLCPQLLIAAATAFIGLGERGGDAAPEALIDHLWDHAGRTGEPEWDAAFVQHCGYWSHFDHRSGHSTWPVIAAATANDLAEFGRASGVLHDAPHDGDIFVQYSPFAHRFGRAGIIAHVVGQRTFRASPPVFDVLSIEGDTGAHGELGGACILRVARQVSAAHGDRFLRWVDLDPAVARPGVACERKNVDGTSRARIAL